MWRGGKGEERERDGNASGEGIGREIERGNWRRVSRSGGC